MKNPSNEYIIFSQKLCAYLMNQGFHLKRIDRSKRNIGKNIFIFNDSEQLQQNIKNFKSLSK